MITNLQIFIFFLLFAYNIYLPCCAPKTVRSKVMVTSEKKKKKKKRARANLANFILGIIPALMCFKKISCRFLFPYIVCISKCDASVMWLICMRFEAKRGSSLRSCYCAALLRFPFVMRPSCLHQSLYLVAWEPGGKRCSGKVCNAESKKEVKRDSERERNNSDEDRERDGKVEWNRK